MPVKSGSTYSADLFEGQGCRKKYRNRIGNTAKENEDQFKLMWLNWDFSRTLYCVELPVAVFNTVVTGLNNWKRI